VLIQAGLALLDCQGFEYGIGFLLFHLSRMGLLDGASIRCMQ